MLDGQRTMIIEFIYENQASLYRLAYSYARNREAALDIVQDTVVQAISHAASLRSAEAVKPWVYRILVRESLAYIKRNQRLVLMEELPEAIAPEEDIGGRLDLYRAVQRLDPKYRIIVILRYYEDLKLEDIARVTGVNLNTVKARLYRALDLLREDLGYQVY